jgi:sugar lactone lactonase YvrE
MRWVPVLATAGLCVLGVVMPLRGAPEDTVPRPWQAFYQDSATALAKGDVEAAITAAERASRVAPPNHPLVLYLQMRAFSRAGRFTEAFAALGLLVEKGIASDVLVSPAFEGLRDHARWPDWQARLQDLVAPTSRSVVAFRLNEPDFIPEAMTYDRGSRRFLIGSLYKRKVVAVDEITGRAADYATFREAGFLSVLGIEADNTRGALYVLSAGGREMQGYTAETDGQSFLHRLQLSSGRQVTKVAPPAVEGGHLLNDLVQAADGTLYMTDSKASVVYRWKPGSRGLETVATIGRHLYPNGITPSADWRALYVAHMEGLSRIDLRTREVTPVGHPASMTLVGIDGLDQYRGDLVAVQNGLPGVSRVVRLRLAADGLNVVAMDVLDANLPDHDIPTTGVVVGDGYYYIANSQLRRFTAPGVAGPAESLQKPVIRRVNLAAPPAAGAKAASSR